MQRKNNKKRQSGSTLIISMIVLVVLMLLGVTSMITSDTQYKLAGNLQFDDMAMNEAEAALARAELELIAVGGADANSLTAGATMTEVTAGEAVLLSTGNRLQESSQVVGGRASTACNVVNTYTVTVSVEGKRGANKTVRSYYSVLSC